MSHDMSGFAKRYMVMIEKRPEEGTEKIKIYKKVIAAFSVPIFYDGGGIIAEEVRALASERIQQLEKELGKAD